MEELMCNIKIDKKVRIVILSQFYLLKEKKTLHMISW